MNILDAQVDEVLADHRLKRFLVGRARLMGTPGIEVWDGDEVPDGVVDLLSKRSVLVRASGPVFPVSIPLSDSGVALCRALRNRVLGAVKDEASGEA